MLLPPSNRRECSVEDCGKNAATKTFCMLHYARWKRHGDPTIVKIKRDYVINDEGRECTVCKRFKKWENFYVYSSGARGHFAVCKPCQVIVTTEDQRIRRYGLDKGAYDELLESQDNKCGICESPGSLFVDHNHETGVVRGFLCRGCNSGIGMLRDDPDLLRKAIEWLERDNDAISS